MILENQRAAKSQRAEVFLYNHLQSTSMTIFFLMKKKMTNSDEIMRTSHHTRVSNRVAAPMSRDCVGTSVSQISLTCKFDGCQAVATTWHPKKKRFGVRKCCVVCDESAKKETKTIMTTTPSCVNFSLLAPFYRQKFTK